MDYSLRFRFIQNNILEKNLLETFEYLIYLLSISNDLDNNKGLRSQNNKLMIVLTSSIIEAVLRYIISKNLPKELNKEAYKYTEVKEIFIKNSNERYVSAKETKLVEERKLDFNELISIANRFKIFDKDLLKNIDIIRKDRNKIHLKLDVEEQEIKKVTVEKHFSTAGEFLLQVEKILTIN